MALPLEVVAAPSGHLVAGAVLAVDDLRVAFAPDTGDLVQVVHGVSFAARCRHAAAACRDAMPALRPVAPGDAARCVLVGPDGVPSRSA